MNTQEINTAARIVGELRGLSLNVPDARFAIICDVCALVIERELRDMTREPNEEALSLEAQRLLADMNEAFRPKFTVIVEGKVQP